MKKTYTIYRNNKRFLSFWGMQRGFALGAMAAIEAVYTSDRYVCKCDQTDEVVETCEPRHVHLN